MITQVNVVFIVSFVKVLGVSLELQRPKQVAFFFCFYGLICYFLEFSLVNKIIIMKNTEVFLRASADYF